MEKQMKVEIWSDVMCPFCYIGKRRFEKALAQFPDSDKVEITWKSYLLNPSMKTEPGKNINEYLSETKGWPLEYAQQMNDRVTEMAEQEGLEYDFDRAVVANARDAHRLIQLAKANNKGDAMEERLFKAYFTEGKNIADHNVLLQLGEEVGLSTDQVQQTLKSAAYSEEVEKDIYEAYNIGVRGVPYFVFNDRYAVSGAQHAETFLGALQKSFGEWKKENKQVKDISGDDAAVCSVDGECN
jgi:predicted DsbA family dithiol-disulfide isomerase